ncbi:metal-dependent hydrolase [Kerstersia gyiorum]|uniref:metal-dependent hydrolase n=1 Tax=Kerstersia gyiorum TaxID=206506 RepID=UPI00107128C9|nr:metal-dependent hydrolase [Kerstersia gyiorum]QBR41054.1 metal-dependent hydrolase [Kerstersia gyiorum]
MDSLTQAVLGGALQGSLLGRWQGRRALAYGAALATLPDLDVLIRYADPVSMMTYHRGFSHSLFVLTGLAAVLTGLIRWRWPQAAYGWQRLFLTLWLVLVTHPLLDAFTVYGTQLFWPLQLVPASWAGVFIIDPVYTLPLLGAVLYGVWRGCTVRARRLMAAALAFSILYLGFGCISRMVAEHRVSAELQARGVAVTELRGVPMPFNTLLWRVLARTPDGGYYEAVSGLFDQAPPELLRQPLNQELALALAVDPLHQRLRWFTDGWLRYDQRGNALVVTDLRMGVPGSYTFRFKMAEQDAQGQWQHVVPSAWESQDTAGSAELGLLFRRIWRQDPPLPLQHWMERFL